MVFVMKSGGGDLLEELFVDSFIPSVIDGAVVAWKITARSKFRG
jgi:hypothetical protein